MLKLHRYDGCCSKAGMELVVDTSKMHGSLGGEAPECCQELGWGTIMSSTTSCDARVFWGVIMSTSCGSCVPFPRTRHEPTGAIFTTYLRREAQRGGGPWSVPGRAPQEGGGGSLFPLAPGSTVLRDLSRAMWTWASAARIMWGQTFHEAVGLQYPMHLFSVLRASRSVCRTVEF